MLNRHLLVSVFLGCCLVGCGLRVQPGSPDGGTGLGGRTGGLGGAGTGSGGTGAGGGGAGGGATGVGGGGVGGALADAGSETPQCTTGSACDPTNLCHIGQTVCSASEAASCTDTGQPQGNGTDCGMNMVCNNGTCAACTAGTACPVTANPCRIGSITCTTGVPVCTETDNQPDGTSCGTGMVCQAGVCGDCQNGAACTPSANACHQGALTCATGTPQCTDKGTLVAAGTACGTNKVCSAAGVCGSCTVGASCTVTGKPCQTAMTTCNTGVAVCVAAGNVANGTSCGTNMVCSAGACVACTAGLACTPANPCHAGVAVCSPAITCSDTGRNLANGSTCATNKVCDNGTCMPCTSGTSCTPTTALCRTGATSCVTGASVCAVTGNQANGTSCGTNKVCDNGVCAACTPGGACTPTDNPCHTGTFTCQSGTAVCADSGTAVADGTSCGASLVCKTGKCGVCITGVTCMQSNICKNGTTSCITGTSVCTASSNKPVGFLCGAAQTCTGGVQTSAAMCDATQMCKSTTTTCPNGCNTAGNACMACPAGETMCSSGCQNLDSDPKNCKTCGNVCPVPTHGSAVCTTGTCGISCNANYAICSAACCIIDAGQDTAQDM